ncbi:MAG: hypothetical protein RR501_12600 [Cloacibacillus sp.]
MRHELTEAKQEAKTVNVARDKVKNMDMSSSCRQPSIEHLALERGADGGDRRRNLPLSPCF